MVNCISDAGSACGNLSRGGHIILYLPCFRTKNDELVEGLGKREHVGHVVKAWLHDRRRRTCCRRWRTVDVALHVVLLLGEVVDHHIGPRLLIVDIILHVGRRLRAVVHLHAGCLEPWDCGLPQRWSP